MKSKISLAAATLLMPGLFFSTPASASFQAAFQSTNNLMTASWSISPAVKGGTPQNIPLELDNWMQSGQLAYSYLDGVNTGSTQVTKTTLLAISVASGNAGNSGCPGNSGNAGNSGNSGCPGNSGNAGNANASVSFEVCDGGEWNTANHSCSGNVLVVGSYTGANSIEKEIMQTLEVSERVKLRAITESDAIDDLETNISFSVSRSSVRGPVSINS